MSSRSFLSSRKRALLAALGIVFGTHALASTAHASEANVRAIEATTRVVADDVPCVKGLALDDSVLEHQRGSGVGPMTVAATAQLMQVAQSVTLWDEVVPPAPIDIARSGQGNVVTYTRK